MDTQHKMIEHTAEAVTLVEDAMRQDNYLEQFVGFVDSTPPACTLGDVARCEKECLTMHTCCLVGAHKER